MEGVTQNWKITRIDVLPELGTLTNVVNMVEWALVTNASTLGGHRHVSIGQTVLSLPNSDNYIPLESLTREQTWSWVQEIVGTARIREIEANGAQYAITVINTQTQTITNLNWIESID